LLESLPVRWENLQHHSGLTVSVSGNSQSSL
jgi:hypothetical protein